MMMLLLTKRHIRKSGPKIAAAPLSKRGLRSLGSSRPGGKAGLGQVLLVTTGKLLMESPGNPCHQKQTNRRGTKYYLQAKNLSPAGFAWGFSAVNNRGVRMEGG